jgi:hypothetical protein
VLGRRQGSRPGVADGAGAAQEAVGPAAQDIAPTFATVELVPAVESVPRPPATLTLVVRSPAQITAEFTRLDAATAAALLRLVLTTGAA